MTDENPKLFISYSWSTPEHEQWVLNLAVGLREEGVDVILDKWDLKEGHDAFAFMEKMVTDSEIRKVAIICDRVYSEKANDRSGGVGTETQIISPKIYEKEDQNKFVAVLAERDNNGNAYLPIYYKSRKYIDLSDNDLYATNFEILLRWIYDKPLYIKPILGTKPSYLSEDNQVSLGTTAKFKRALDGIRNNKEYAKGAIADYFSTFTSNLEGFRITDKDGEIDDKVIDNIDKFIPFRNEVIELFLSIAQYRNTTEAIQQVHRFFEGLIPYRYRPEGVSSHIEWDLDNFKFIVHELFLYAISCLLKFECFESVAYLMQQKYYVERNSDYGRDVMVAFSILRDHLKSLEHRNNRLELRRLSLHADILEKRSKTSGVSLRHLMQADFVLFMKDCLSCITNNTTQEWWPITLLYIEKHSGPFEIFARAESKEYFDKLKSIFGIKGKNEFSPVLQAFKEDKLRVPRWDSYSFDPAKLLGYEKMATIA